MIFINVAVLEDSKLVGQRRRKTQHRPAHPVRPFRGLENLLPPTHQVDVLVALVVSEGVVDARSEAVVPSVVLRGEM